MRNLKVIVIAAALALLFLSVGLMAADEKYEEKFAKSEAIALDGKVMISNVSGDVMVKTWDKGEVKIDAVKTSRASSMDKAKENAQQVNIEVTNADNTVRIKVKYPEGEHHHLNVSVNFELTIPSKAALDATSVSGDVKVEKIGGTLKAGTVSGNTTVLGALKGVDANTVSGDVKVADVVGDAYLKTVSGEVEAEHVTGSIEAETVSGDVKLTDISEAKTVSGKALSGNVTYKGKLNKEGRYTFNAHSGDITVTIPADSAFEFTGETFSGDISTDFKVEVSGKMSKRELHGTVNGGGAVLKLKAFSGNVELKKG